MCIGLPLNQLSITRVESNDVEIIDEMNIVCPQIHITQIISSKNKIQNLSKPQKLRIR